MASQVPRSAMAAQAPCSAMAAQAPRSAMAARAPRSAVGPRTGAVLEASCPVLSPCPLRPPEHPPPLPVCYCYGAGRTYWEGGGGGVMSGFWTLVSLFSPVLPEFLYWCFLFLFLLVNHRLVLSPVLYYSSRLRIRLFCFISLQFSPCLCRVLKYVRLMLYSLLFSSFILLKNLLFLKPLSPCLPGSANHYRNTKTNPNPNHIVSTCS